MKRETRRVRVVVWIVVVLVTVIGLSFLSAALGYGSLRLLPLRDWGFGVSYMNLAIDRVRGLPTLVIPVRRDIDLGPVSWQTPIPIDWRWYERKSTEERFKR